MTKATNRDPDLLWRLVCQKDEVNDTLRREIETLRAERDKFERAWNDMSDRYEALLNQIGATDA